MELLKCVKTHRMHRLPWSRPLAGNVGSRADVGQAISLPHLSYN